MRIWFVGKKTGIALGAIVILFFALILFGHINKTYQYTALKKMKMTKKLPFHLMLPGITLIRKHLRTFLEKEMLKLLFLLLAIGWINILIL